MKNLGFAWNFRCRISLSPKLNYGLLGAFLGFGCRMAWL